MEQPALYAYAAGIVDGEGSIDIFKVSSKGKNCRYALRVVVGTTDEWLSQFLHNSFGGFTYFSPRLPHRGIWYWQITSRKAADFLNLITPYLQIKKAQADLAITFQSKKYRRHAALTENEMAVEEAQKILMQNYHKGTVNKEALK